MFPRFFFKCSSNKLGGTASPPGRWPRTVRLRRSITATTHTVNSDVKKPSSTHKRIPPGRISRKEAKPLRSPELARVHMPALPALTRQIKRPHDAQQLVSRVWDCVLAGNPLPNSARRDVKNLRGSVVRKPRIRQQDFKARAKHGTVFTAFSGGQFATIVLHTIYIMLINISIVQNLKSP